MKKYSKGKLKLKRMVIILVIILILLLIFSSILLFCFCLRDRFDISSQENDAINVSDDIAANSSPIIVDNLVLGATYDSKWVSANKYYFKSNNKSDVEIYVYNKQNRAGTYKLKDLYTSSDSVYVNTSYPNYIDEYFALTKDNGYALISQFENTQVEEKDYKYVNKALKLYKLYNSTINIKNVYKGYINVNTPVRLLEVTSQDKGAFGGIYSCIIIAYPNESKANILQYSYTKDLDNSDDFPLYSVEFLADFNGDGNCEIVTREVTEFNVTYNLFEYKDNKFYEVLSETMKSK